MRHFLPTLQSANLDIGSPLEQYNNNINLVVCQLLFEKNIYKFFCINLRAGPKRGRTFVLPNCGNLYSDVFPFCLFQPRRGFGPHLYTATLRPLRWLHRDRSYGLSWVAPVLGFALPLPVPLLYHGWEPLSRGLRKFFRTSQSALGLRALDS